MLRATLASVVVAASFAISGCTHFCMQFDSITFGHRRDPCCREPCCPTGSCCNGGGYTADAPPAFDGPILAPPDQPLPDNGGLPIAPPPRLVPSPQSAPSPYRP
jgi:hypothetical protein